MAAKLVDFMQKYVHLNNAGDTEAIFRIVLLRVLFYIKAQTREGSIPEAMGLFFGEHTFKMAANTAN
jgi:hypothetical protein